MDLKKPQVGIGVLIFNNNKILLGKRKSSHGSGSWAPPGGHLHFGETFFECAIREVKEEVDLEIYDLIEGPTTNDIFVQEDKHYITIFIIAKKFNGKLKLIEPEKCEQWKWFNIGQLPDELFLPFKNLIEKYDLKVI